MKFDMICCFWANYFKKFSLVVDSKQHLKKLFLLFLEKDFDNLLRAKSNLKSPDLPKLIIQVII